MDSKLSSAQADPHHAGDVVLLAPKDWMDAEEALSKLAHVASDRRRPAAGSDFLAGPRMTEPSLDTRPRQADVKDAPLPTDRPPLGKRISRGFARFLLAACIGVAATLAWQTYGDATKQMIANAAPQLDWLLSLLPATNPPSGREITGEQPSQPAASAPQAASAQTGAAPSTLSEAAASAAPADPALDLRQLETMSHDLAVVRESIEQLAASQEQIARDIAKLQTDGQDIRRRISALQPAITARKPFPPPQGAAQPTVPPPPPQPAPQAAAAAPPASASQPAPQPAAPPAEPALRPPMPVR